MMLSGKNETVIAQKQSIYSLTAFTHSVFILMKHPLPVGSWAA